MRVVAKESCEAEDVCLVTRASLAAARPSLASGRSWPG